MDCVSDFLGDKKYLMGDQVIFFKAYLPNNEKLFNHTLILQKGSPYPDLTLFVHNLTQPY